MACLRRLNNASGGANYFQRELFLITATNTTDGCLIIANFARQLKKKYQKKQTSFLNIDKSCIFAIAFRK